MGAVNTQHQQLRRQLMAPLMTHPTAVLEMWTR